MNTVVQMSMDEFLQMKSERQKVSNENSIMKAEAISIYLLSKEVNAKKEPITKLILRVERYYEKWCK